MTMALLSPMKLLSTLLWTVILASPWISESGGIPRLDTRLHGDKSRPQQSVEGQARTCLKGGNVTWPLSAPDYVFEYAPYVHLFSKEEFWPCDIADHLPHTTPHVNYTPIYSQGIRNLNLSNLNRLNKVNHGRYIYLKSDDNVEERPKWLAGKKNIPDVPDTGNPELHLIHNQQKPIHSDSDEEKPHGGRSSAPAILVMVPKPDGILDAFWFFFYSYNLGHKVFNVRFGNHVGDWEHTMVRFHHGKPKYVYVSEHFFGEAYTYNAIEKIGKRPVVYSAEGTHAMYATPGRHPYVLPLGLLHDETDRGPLWDPTKNMHTYTYDLAEDDLQATNATPSAPIEWFHFRGHWGDKRYDLQDSRQYVFAGQYHYVNGPLGPKAKNLGRKSVCQGLETDPCVIKHWLGGERVRVWKGLGEGDGEMEDGDER